jgi:hypothetical protein
LRGSRATASRCPYAHTIYFINVLLRLWFWTPNDEAIRNILTVCVGLVLSCGCARPALGVHAVAGLSSKRWLWLVGWLVAADGEPAVEGDVEGL